MSNAPNSQAKIQQEAVQTTLPVSEALMFAIAGAINQCLTNSAQVGDVVSSFLALAAFQDQRDDTWVLADGESCAGSEFQALTGLANVPDMRGRFARMKANGAGTDSNGDLALGTNINDAVGNHQHISDGIGLVGVSPPYGSDGASFSGINVNGESFTSPLALTSNPTTGTGETFPKYTVVNFFIKINP